MKDHKNNPRENAASLKQVWQTMISFWIIVSWFPFFRGTYWLCQSVLLSHSLGSPSGSNPSEDPVWSSYDPVDRMDQAFTSHRWKRKHLGIDTIEDMSGPWEETDRRVTKQRLTTNWLNKMDHWHCLRLPGSCFQQMATLEAWGCLSLDSIKNQNMSRDLNLIKGCSEMKGDDTIRSSIHPSSKKTFQLSIRVSPEVWIRSLPHHGKDRSWDRPSWPRKSLLQ